MPPSSGWKIEAEHFSQSFVYFYQNILCRVYEKRRLQAHTCIYIYVHTGYIQKNGAVSKVNNKFISHLTRAQCTPSASATVQVSHALPAFRFSCLLQGRGASFQVDVAAGKGFLCVPF